VDSAVRRAGPLVAINGNMVVQDATDMEVAAQRLWFAVTAASLGF
jgi:hypothetical protein